MEESQIGITKSDATKNNGPLYGLLSVIAVGLFVIIGVATDAIKMNMMIDLVKGFGVPGIVFVLWYFSSRTNQQTLAHYKEDMQRIERMYRNNVHLVEGYEKLSKNLTDVVVMNTTAMTKACESIEKNQFCPIVRERAGQEQNQ